MLKLTDIDKSGEPDVAHFTMTELLHISENIERIQTEIADATARAGRTPGEVTLIAVTKTYPAEYVAAAVRAGLTDAAENRVQEAIPKIETLKGDAACSSLKWHLIGHLQSNKARQAVQNFDMIHSIDSLRLAREINRFAAEENKVMSVLIQVNISGEESKSGFSAGDLENHVNAILDSCPELTIDGFMTMAPFAGPEEARPVFRSLYEIRESLSKKISDPRFSPRELSMGMSGDYKVAIEEGSTMVRIGTAIFGDRS